MSDMMTFPATVEEFMEQYKIVDDEKVYTNGSELIPIFRMMQWFEHVSATDTISRQAAIETFKDCAENGMSIDGIVDALEQLPLAQTEQCIGYWYPVGMAEAVGGESAQWGSAIAYHKCSECDEQALRDDFEQEVLSDFCPHCGVKMVGVSE